MCRALLILPWLALAGCVHPPERPAPSVATKAAKEAAAPAATPAKTAPVAKAATVKVSTPPSTGAPSSAAVVLPAAPSAQAVSPAEALQPSLFVPVGRVLAVDEKAQTAIIELSPYATFSADLDGQTLYARDRELRPVARLQATPNLRGLILGVRSVEGRPAVGDEVVVSAPPPAPMPAAAAPTSSRPVPSRR